MAAYEITAVNQTQRLESESGRLKDYVDVSFVTADGQGAGSVEVAVEPGWEDAARAKIGALAAEITAFIGTTG